MTKVHAKRLDPRTKHPEYLVSWLEYPQEDTWEPMINLENVRDLIESYEGRIRAQQEEYRAKAEKEAALALAKRKEEEKARKKNLEEKSSELRNRGSWQNGDVIDKIMGMRNNKLTQIIECRCEWKPRLSEGNLISPLTSFVTITELRNKDPRKLLDFLEYSGKLFGDDLTMYSYIQGDAPPEPSEEEKEQVK